MFQMPMSSPMMTTMFGFWPLAAGRPANDGAPALAISFTEGSGVDAAGLAA